MSTMASRPWQLDWKRPKWTSLDSPIEYEEADVVDYMAAELAVAETQSILEQREVGGEATQNAPNDVWILTITLLSTSARSQTSTVLADIVVLEIFQYPAKCSHDTLVSDSADDNDDRPKRWLLRTLRWPEVALLSEKRADADTGRRGGASFWGFGNKDRTQRERENATSGRGLLAAACLCRVPPRNASAALADALDVLHLMSLQSRTGGITSNQQEWLHKLQDERSDKAAEPQMLLLTCLTNTGYVYFYNAVRLLQSGFAASDSVPDIDHSMATLLLGSDIYSAVRESFLPLTEPLASSRVSVSMRTSSEQRRRDREEPVIEEDVVDEESSRRSFNPVSVWDASFWNPIIDRDSLVYETRYNRPQLIVAALEYVCVAGSGRRRRRKRFGLDASVHSRSSFTEHPRYESTRSTATTTAPDGGFVSFFSLETFSEVRTVYLPFVPVKLSPIIWGGWVFLLVAGHGSSVVAIRIDSLMQQSVIEGQAPSIFDQSAKKMEEDKPLLTVQRFQMLPVLLVDGSLHADCILLSSLFTDPPSMACIHQDHRIMSIALLNFSSIDRAERDVLSEWRDFPARDGIMATIGVTKRNRGIATLALAKGDAFDQTNGYLGQGWCLIEVSSDAFFVCFDGATEEAAYVYELCESDVSFGSCINASVVPLNPFVRPQDKETGQTTLPFAGRSQATGKSSDLNLIGDDAESEQERIIAEAMERISTKSYRETFVNQTSFESPRRKSSAYTNREKSERLLEKSSSWNLLQASKLQGALADAQHPVICCRVNNPAHDCFVFSIRQAVVKNGAATPFHQVLSWLSQRGDYFSAASLALDLLGDLPTLRHLWKAIGRISRDDERLDGLLDDIILLSKSGQEQTDYNSVVQLADMTVGCLARGGYEMSSTLEYFLTYSKRYDAARASLVLVAMAAVCLSDDEDAVIALMGPASDANSHEELKILWPVKCLLALAVARDFLGPALSLLNTAIPDELRHRRRSSLSYESIPSLDTCKALLTLIISCATEGLDLLMSLCDEQSGLTFWQSLESKTQFDLVLLAVNGQHPLLLHTDVRSWVIDELDRSVKAAGRNLRHSLLKDDQDSPWLQDLLVACMTNAQCELEYLVSSPSLEQTSDASGIQKYRQCLWRARRAMEAGKETGGMDFGLVIPALLVLNAREVPWSVDAEMPTNVVLNAACYHAGRPWHGKHGALFALNGPLLMRQCTIVHNVEAGANLVGGRAGLVLNCCDILMRKLGFSMEQAEEFLTLNSFVPVYGYTEARSHVEEFKVDDFYRRLLLLLEEHVLIIRTFGEFDTAHVRGKVDPVEASRICLRTWWALSRNQTSVASAWLESWLNDQLADETAKNGLRRFASAALTRALIWPADDGSLLADKLELTNSFILNLALSCCGLAEAVPPSMIYDVEDPQPRAEITSRLQLYDSIDESFDTAASY